MQREAHQSLIKMREKQPHVFKHPATLARVHELLATYSFHLSVSLLICHDTVLILCHDGFLKRAPPRVLIRCVASSTN